MNNIRSKTALITGASSGVGIEFAKQLAERDYNLVLTARRMDRLEQLQHELQQSNSIQIDLIRNDLGKPHGAEELIEATSQFQIDFLVNNAGLGIFRPAIEHTVEEIDNMIMVNLRSLTILTRHFAAKMVDQNNGRILNHASFAGIHPSPWYSVYSGTKAFVLDFSTTVNHELKGTGVSVTTLCPGFFRSEFQDKSGRNPGRFGRKVILEADYIARQGIEAALKRRSIVIPSIKYKILNVLVRLFPRPMTLQAADWLVHS